MARRIIANSFVGGEISPDLYGRHDLAQYFKGAASIENMIVRRTGGARKRPGTNYLFTIDLAEGDVATLDNKYKLFDFFFDADSFGLLAFRLTTGGEAQAKFVSVTNGTVDSTDWTAVGVDLDITTTDQFDSLKCKQIGDTMFFTRSGMKSFKCVVTFADPSISFEMIPNNVSVEKPSAMMAVARGFGVASSGLNSTDYTAAPKTYAIWGVKDGVFSKPFIVTTGGGSVSGDVVTSPWRGGAKVTLSGVLDFGIHDYYVIGKKTGVNFGKISEIYPDEGTTELVATIPASPANDLVYRDALFATAFNESASLLFTGNPLRKASDVPTITLTPNCLAIKTTEFTESAETWYRCATPIYELTVPEGAGTITGHLFCNQKAAACPGFTAQAVDLKSVSGLRITIMLWSNESIDVDSVQTVSADSSGIARFTFSLPAGVSYVSMIVESKNAKMADALFLGKVGFWWLGNYQAIDRVIDPNPYANISGQQFLDPSFGEYYDASWITGLTGDAVQEKFDQLKCNPVAFAKYNGTAVTCLWNTHTLAGTALAAGSGAGSESALVAAGTTQAMTIADADDFHAYLSWFSELYFDIAANVDISSIVLHLGGYAASLDGRIEWPDSADYSTATLYAYVGSAWVQVNEFDVRLRYFAERRLAISYPETVPSGTTKFKLVFSVPAVVRGIDLAALISTFSFIDDNLLPGTISGIQEMLTVGDDEMDAGLVDVVQQRLVYSTSEEEPFTLWFSAVGDLYNFYANRPQADNDAFSITLPATRASKILHILSGSTLLLFTEDGVYSCSSGNGDLFSFRTATIKKICGATAHADILPIEIDGKVVFVGDDGRTVYELKYSMMDDALLPLDRSVFAMHLTEGKAIVKAAYQRFPESVIWFLLDDGTLASMTYMPDQEVFAWSHHAIATVSDKYKLVDIFAPGSKSTGDDAETTSDVLLVYEIRSGATLQDHVVVERMRSNVCQSTVAISLARCIDHAGTPLPDDYPTKFQPLTVSPDETLVACSLTTLRPETQEVSTQGIPKRVVDVCLRIRRTGQIGVVPFDASLTTMYLTPAVVAGTDVTLASKDVKIVPRGYINDDGQLLFQSADQYPCEILSAVYTMDLPE
jgi:hypothetical protein